MNAGAERKNPGIDVRRALAGIGLLRGLPLGPALREGGFSPWTARAPRRNRINADQCLREARKLSPNLDPAKLVSDARRVMLAKLTRLAEDPQLLERTRLGELVRVLEVAEKCYRSAS